VSLFQSFFSVLTQMAPLAATLGWKIFVMKKPDGPRKEKEKKVREGTLLRKEE
jgi:hypothetical protein